MKVPGLGFAAALFLLAVAPSAAFAAPPSTPASHAGANDDGLQVALDGAQRAQGKKQAPALLTASKTPCTMTDAYYIGGGTGSDKIHANYYEVACQEGVGYILIARDKAPAPDAVDCLKFAGKGADGKPNPLACRLPENRHPALAMQSVVNTAGHTCTITNGRYIGSTQAVDIYEMACSEGGGYILETSHTGSAPPKTTNCMIYKQLRRQAGRGGWQNLRGHGTALRRLNARGG